MSGILSLYRELMGMYRPDLVGSSKQVFWTCVRIAFILTAFAFIWNQSERIKKLEAKSKSPDFRGKANAVLTGMWNGVPQIVVGGTISNRQGTASGAVDWKISVELEDSSIVEGKFPPLPAQDIKVQNSPIGEVTLPVAKYLPIKMLEPLPVGGTVEGWIQAILPTLTQEDLYNKKAVVVIEFKDVITGKLHSFKEPIGERGVHAPWLVNPKH